MVAEGLARETRWYLDPVPFLGPIGTPELIIIMVVLLLLFGAKRLPEMGRSIGRGMREFKEAVSGEEKPDEKPHELDPPELEPADPREETEQERAEREHVR
jgi:sec-independent protein translocase protein TatA